MTDSNISTWAKMKGHSLIDLVLNGIYPVGVVLIIGWTYFGGTWGILRELALMLHWDSVDFLPEIIVRMLPPLVIFSLLLMTFVKATRLWIRWMDGSRDDLDNQHT